MEPSDWTEAATAYQRDVLSVFDRDRQGQVRALIQRHSSQRKSCLDLGCGPGKFLPLLGQHFQSVHGCDYSEDMLATARKETELPNLTLERCDLRRRAPKCAPADFVICVNTLLHPQLSARERMWPNVAASVKRGGHLVLVVPSLESALFSRHRLAEWNLRSGIPAKEALRRSFGNDDPNSAQIARGGVLDAGGTLTKHYLQEEIESTGSRFGLSLESCQKIEYPWTTEFHRPPRWMKAPFPWDWLAVLRKD
jgi:SAM-dependent methyltransferase